MEKNIMSQNQPTIFLTWKDVWSQLKSLQESTWTAASSFVNMQSCQTTIDYLSESHIERTVKDNLASARDIEKTRLINSLEAVRDICNVLLKDLRN